MRIYAFVFIYSCPIIIIINTGNLLGATKEDSSDEKVKPFMILLNVSMLHAMTIEYL